MSDIASISIKNFRAIREANISINGITVVSGINGSGKSTISMLLYDIFRYANDYYSLISDELVNSLQPYVDLVYQIRHYVYSGIRLDKSRKYGISPYSVSIPSNYLDESNDALFYGYIHELFSTFKQLTDNNVIKNTERIDIILSSSLKIRSDASIEEIEAKLHEAIDPIIQKARMELETRPAKYIRDKIASRMGSNITGIEASELNGLLYSSSIKNVPIPHTIKKVAYINTPMSIGLNYFGTDLPEEWKRVNLLMSQKPQRSYSRKIANYVKDDIVNGEFKYDENLFDGNFVYIDKKNRKIDLSECATGIRSFGALYLLLKTGFLDDNTMLILDEPEAHLHPQWIVEYANLLVLLRKKLGIYIFIVSHSTDMVSAIKNIAVKRKLGKDLSFYLAVADKSDSTMYRFSPLKDDIEPIFSSFNKSFEYIDNYSE